MVEVRARQESFGAVDFFDLEIRVSALGNLRQDRHNLRSLDRE